MLNPRPSQTCVKCVNLYPDEKSCPCICHVQDLGPSKHYMIHKENQRVIVENNDIMMDSKNDFD